MYQIPNFRIDKLHDQVAKLNRKAVQLFGANDAPQIKITHFSSEVVERRINGKEITMKVQNVDLSVPEEFKSKLKINGWEFVAKIEHYNEGNVVSKMKTSEVEVPEDFRTIKPNCDHCKTTRTRFKTYLLFNSQEYAQVGSSCLKDFMGHKNPERLAEIMESILELINEYENLDDWDMSFSTGRSLLSLNEYLPWVFLVAEKSGWLSRSNCPYEKIPTADNALNSMVYNDDEFQPTEEHKEKAQKAIELVKTFNSASMNDYQWNLHMIVNNGFIEYNQLGYAASIYISFMKNNEWVQEQKKRDEENENSEFIGTIKERVEFTNLELISTLPIDGYYGTTILHKFIDENGNILVWFSSTQNLDSYQTIENKRERGEIIDENNPPRFSGKATIKEHKEFRGEKQTIITRAKFK